MRMLLRAAICVTVMLLSMATPSQSLAQCGGRWLTSPEMVPAGFSVVNSAVTLSNDDIVVSGAFTTAGGLPANNVARWNGFCWSPLGSGLDRGVNTLKILSNGDLIAGGSFLTANDGTTTVNRIARWNGSTWLAIGSGVTGGLGYVYALAELNNGNIVAGGSFNMAGQTTTNNITRWNGVSWVPMRSGMNGDVLALAVLPNGNLIAAGSFTTAGGVPANYIAQWIGGSWSPLGSGMSSQVHALAVMPNGDLIAAGTFSTAGGVAASCIARWNGTNWSSLGSGVSGGSVSSLKVLANGDLLVGGRFPYAGGGFVGYVARWNGSSWSTVGGGVSQPFYPVVSALTERSNGDVLVGGEFTSAGEVITRNIALWNGSAWRAIGGGFDYMVTAFSLHPDGDIVMGGHFSTAGGVPAKSVVRWNGASFASVGTAPSSFVNLVAVRPNRDIIAGGVSTSFTTPMARWNGVSWSVAGTFENLSTNASLQAVSTLSSGDVVIGGVFVGVNGVGTPRIARWNGVSWSAIGSGMNDRVYALTVMPNGDLIAGGNFTIAGGVTANRIARWNGSIWAEIGGGVTNPSSPNDVHVNALAVAHNGDLIAAGHFTNAGDVAANCIARWNGSSWSSIGSGVTRSNLYQRISALSVLPNGDIIAGGAFTEAGGVPANYIARWNGSSWTSLGSGMGPSADYPEVLALSVHPSGELIVGGRFTSAGGLSSGYFARWTETGIPWIARQPLSQTVNAEETLTLTATCASGYDFDGPVTYQWQRNGVNIVNGPAGASPNGGTVTGASGALPVPTNNPSATLTITGVQPGDTGEYTIIFANGCGGVTSTPAIVTVTGGCSADFNSDTVVDLFDYIDFVAAFAANAPEADFNADTVIDFFDYLDFVEEFATGC